MLTRLVIPPFTFAFLGSLVLVAPWLTTPSAAAEKDKIPYQSIEGDKYKLRWYDAKDLRVEGRGYSDVKSYYDRLPAKAEGVVRDPVWVLSRNSSGMCVWFDADTPQIAVRWTLLSPNYSLPHMADTGANGVDLYGKAADGTWRWIAVGKPSGAESVAVLSTTLPAGMRTYRVYLPLYNGVTKVQIGLPAKAKIAQASDSTLEKKPVVFYGTSIMQGACASRTGMAQSSIIGRRLGVPVINLGFSGNGKMEPEIGKLLAELDPAVYVLDALPNCDAKEVAERTEPLVRTLREAHPETPIVLVEDRTYADSYWNPSRLERNVTSRKEYKAAYERLVKAGVKGLTYVEGGQLLREDGEDTVDGSHPTDLGFMRYADVLAPIIKPLLK
jgi:hypothetical protein